MGIEIALKHRSADRPFAPGTKRAYAQCAWLRALGRTGMSVELTEKEAAIAFARAWNRLDAAEFLSLLAPDAKYASQWVLEELQGKDAIGDYLRTKLKTVNAHAVNNPQSKVRVEIGITQAGDVDRPCAYMKQGVNEAVVIFTINGGKISRYDLCIPQLYRPDRSCVYPI